jgi:hypothetical protein
MPLEKELGDRDFGDENDFHQISTTRTATELALMYIESSSQLEKAGYRSYVDTKPDLFRMDFYDCLDN